MRILFYGDSITDAWSYHKPREEFAGYVKYAAELLGDGNEYFNCGISGNRSGDLLARYEEDVKAFSPDVIVILIGINDVWRAFSSTDYTSPETFGKNLCTLLSQIKRDLPKAKIVLMEPYLLSAPDKAYWRPLLAFIIEEVRNAAVKYADAFVPLDGLLNAARLHIDRELLAADGVHPVEEGAKLIAKYVAEAVRSVL